MAGAARHMVSERKERAGAHRKPACICVESGRDTEVLVRAQPFSRGCDAGSSNKKGG